MNGALHLALVLVFALLLSGLVMELLYVLWYRRRFRKKSSASDDIERSVASSAIGSDLFCFGARPPSKELVLYHLCWKSRSRIDPVDVAPAFAVATPIFPISAPPSPPPPPPPVEEEEEHDEEMEKFCLLYGSRLLYTIREEDKESVPDQVTDRVGVASQRRERETESPQMVEADVMDTEDEDDNSTLFSSACSSPLYTTPPSSPPHPTVDV